LKAGEVLTGQRRFTHEEVILFGELSQNKGFVHIEPDASGRLMVQGLLTASLSTKIGGDLNCLAKEMTFIFIRPVYTGDTITCKFYIDCTDKAVKGTKVWFSYECSNQNDEKILTGSGKGIILNTF